MRITAFMIIVLMTGLVEGTDITVGPQNADYTNIFSAVNNASTGDIIKVYSGHYLENLHITNKITLLGIDNGGGIPVIDANGTGSAVSFYADGITVKGFNITNSGHCGCGNAGISIQSDNNTIIGNTICKNKYGIYIRDGKNNKILFNDLIDNEISIFENCIIPQNSNASLENTTIPETDLSNNTILGNYYDDYDGTEEGCNDANLDGICDFPRKFETAQWDDCPMTLPWRQ